MANLIALDTLGLIADRQSTVPPELKNALEDYGRNQLAISFTDDQGKNGSFLEGFLIVTSTEAELFVESENPTEGLSAIVAGRKALEEQE